MAGRRSTNLRKGDLAEGLGIEMLRSFTAVAPVPRSEDIGIDVICTLLRPEAGMQYAEDSFYVQIKSVSVSAIDYREEAYKWLWNLSLPIFVARVSISDAYIEIFSMQRVFTRAKPFSQGVKVLLGEKDSNQDNYSVNLGQPILKWHFNEIAGKGFHEGKYQIMKAWVRHEHENWFLRRAKRSKELSWNTNRQPWITGSSFSVNASNGNIVNILEEMHPFLRQLVAIFLEKVINERKDEDFGFLLSSVRLYNLANKYQFMKDPLSAPDILMLCINTLDKIYLKEGIENNEARRKRILAFLRNLGLFEVN
jgi:hypothetical protein